jgi:hypothetical protein
LLGYHLCDSNIDFYSAKQILSEDAADLLMAQKIAIDQERYSCRGRSAL